MNKDEIKLFSAISVAIGAAIWLLFFLIQAFDVISSPSLRAINFGATGTGIFWVLYFRWGWKQPFIKRILYRPNVGGTWLGEFDSDWQDENGKENPPKRFILVIRQQWFSLSIIAFTEQQKTESYVETMMIDASKGTKFLVYLYSEKRLRKGAYGVRQGAAELDLVENSSTKHLEGHFWTLAGTRGSIKVKHVSEANLVESFYHATENWADKNSWAVL